MKRILFNVVCGVIAISATAQTHHDISEKDSIKRKKNNVELGEVVVTASIANARAKKAIGADVEAVNIEKLMSKTSTTSFSEMLNGRISGIQMFQTNGKVGMPVLFNVRSGATLSLDRDPIIYVDGVRYNNSNISDINSSQDALSMLVDLPLDDIAFINVIKGPAAAASYGAEAANGVIVITTKTGANIKKGIEINGKVSVGFSSLGRKYSDFVNNDNVNNFFETGIQTKLYANLTKAFSPGNKLYFSVNQQNVTGIVPGNKDQRLNLRTAYDLRQDRFSMNVAASYTRGQISIPQTAMGRTDAIWNLIRTQEPWQYVSERTWRAQRWTYDNDRFIGSLKMSYILPYDIKAETVLGFDNNFVKGNYTLPYGYLLNNNEEGAKQLSDRRNANFNWDVKLNKQFRLADQLNLSLTVLSQIVRQYETANTINVSQFSGDVENVAAAKTRTVGEISFEQRTWGLYGEAFLNYQNRLFINLGLRRDASNLIGANVTSILYPSLSIAYNFPNLKLRSAYGESGRLPYPSDAQTVYVMNGASAYGPKVTPSTMGNPNIKPERMRELELGVDYTLGQHNFSFTGYAQFTSDAIIYVPLAPSKAWPGARPENLGKVKGLGAEMKWNGTLLQSSNHHHKLSMFITANVQGNKVTDTGGQDIYNYPNVIMEGQPSYAFYYFDLAGANFNASGKYIGAKETTEKKLLGKPTPSFFGSFGWEATLWKDFTISTVFNYSMGQSVYNQGYYNVAGLGDNLKNRNDLLALLGTQTIGTPEYINTAEALAKTERIRANYIFKADYLRWSSLSLSYNLSKVARSITHNVMKDCRIILTGENLALITNYFGLDPQTDGNGGTRKVRGMGTLGRDIYNAPNPRTITATLSFKF